MVYIFWHFDSYLNRRNYASILHVHRNVIIIHDQTGLICVEKRCHLFSRRRRALLFWRPQPETVSVVPHGLRAQVQQICQCFTETPRGHKRDRSRTPDSSHRVLWHLEGKVKHSRVGFSARLSLSPLPVTSGDGRSPVGATCRNLGYCGQRARSQAARQRDENRRFNFSSSHFAPEASRWHLFFGVHSQRLDVVIWSCFSCFLLEVCVAKITMNMLREKSRDYLLVLSSFVVSVEIWEITIHHFPFSELWLFSVILLILSFHVCIFFF